MTSLLLAALLSVSPAEAHNTQKRHAKPHIQHHKNHKPAVKRGFTWVWVSGHWERRNHSTVWVWGHWDLRPTPRVQKHHPHKR